MNKNLRLGIWAGTALLATLLVALAAALFFVDPNALKPLLVERVQRDYQRTLDIPGRVSLSLFPSIGVKLGEVSLSAQGSDEPFASARAAHVSLALLPILRGQWVVDRVRVEGLNLRLVRSSDGRTSIDDLLGREQAEPVATSAPEQPAPSGAGAVRPLAFDIAGLTITDATLDLRDELAGRHVVLAGLQLETGRLAPDVASPLKLQTRLRVDAPTVDAELSIDGKLLLAPTQGRYAVEPLSLRLAGRLATLADAELKLSATAAMELAPLALQLTGVQLNVAGSLPEGPASVRMALPQLDWREGRVAAQALQLNFSSEQGARKLQGRLGIPGFSGSGAALQLPGLSGDLTVSEGPLQAKAQLAGSLTLDTEAARLSSGDTRLQLTGSQGETVIDGTLQAAWQLDLKAATLAVSKWQVAAALPNPGGGALKLQAAGELALGPAPQALALSAVGTLDASRFKLDMQTARLAPAAWRFGFEVDELDLDRYRAPQVAAGAASALVPAAGPIDLSALQGLDARGSLRVGQLRAANVRLAELRAEVAAGSGELAVRQMQARLYQGRVEGEATVTTSARPRMAVQAQLRGVSLGPLLHDALGKSPIEGRGDVMLNLQAQGSTVTDLTKSLAGDARVALRNGAVRGFNIAQAIRSARAALGRAPAGAAPAGEALSTDFSALDGSFKLADGVAHTDDLQAKSPLLRVGVVGDVDLGAGRLDCRVQATVVATLKGQGGPELQALRGQTIPVRLYGPFDAIDYSVDLKSLGTAAVREKVEQQVDKAREDLQERVKDKLRGLFGK